MSSPEIVASISAHRQEILDSGKHIAEQLVGEDAIKSAQELDEIEQSALSNLSDEEYEAYREGGLEERPTEEGVPEEELELFPEHERILDLVQQAPIIAEHRVEDAQGFTLASILPVSFGAMGQQADKMPDSLLLADEGRMVVGRDVVSRLSKWLTVVLAKDTIVLRQSNSLYRYGGLLMEPESADPLRKGGVEITSDGVKPDLTPEGINAYLDRYAATIKGMEDLPVPELKREIEPHLSTGWKISDEN